MVLGKIDVPMCKKSNAAAAAPIQPVLWRRVEELGRVESNTRRANTKPSLASPSSNTAAPIHRSDLNNENGPVCERFNANVTALS